MMTTQIEDRINELIAERGLLEASHNALIQQHQQVTSQFHQAVARNQTRYAQINGAIAELQQLITQENQNHDHIPSITRSHNRTADVHPGSQSQDS